MPVRYAKVWTEGIDYGQLERVAHDDFLGMERELCMPLVCTLPQVREAAGRRQTDPRAKNANLGASAYRDRFFAVLRLVDMLADERHHITRASYSSQARVEDQFRHSRGCLDLGLKNVRL